MRSTYCIYPVSSTQQISKSPINTSPSKQLFSFSRENRFKVDRKYCDNIYDIPSYFRATPSRVAKVRSSRRNLQLDPLRFDSSDRFDNRVLNVGPTYSLRRKTKVIDKKMSIEPQNNNPGSGAYENPEMLSPTGHYFHSKHKDTGQTRFNPSRSRRFFEFQNLNPGPGRYEEVNRLNDSGNYALSQSFGGGKRFFDRQRRVVKFEEKARKDLNPGPGSYRSSSDFGHYDGNVYNWTGGISYISPGQSRISKRTSRTRF